MNFHQAPITRYLRLQDRAAAAITAAELTVGPQAFSATAPVISASSWVSGRAVNVFFETPTWPSSAFSINLEYAHGAAGSPLLVAPNVMIEDDGNVSGIPNVTNHFIRGNVAFANTLNTVINVTYCGVLTNVVPVGARASAANYNWVQTADTLDISGNNQVAHNLAASQNITLLAVRAKGGPDSYYVEFNAPLDLTGTGRVVKTGADTTNFPTSTATPASAATEAAYELTLKYVDQGVDKFRKLAVDGLTLAVIGKDSGGTTVFTGTLVGSVNVTYANNNKTGLLAGFFDPSRFMQVSRAWANANFRPLSTVATTAFNSQRISIDRDYVSGAEPYRCIAIINSGTVAAYPQLAITINPIN